MTLPKEREATIAQMGTRETELSKTISDAERDRRAAAVNNARASVGLAGFSLSGADEAHAQHLIDGEVSLNEFVRLHGSLEHSKT